MIRAAVVRECGQRFDIENVELAEPGPGEVLVRIKGVGICHSDIAAAKQQLPFPLPAVLGHEGAGIVEQIGSGVTSLVPGDEVVLTFMSCGDCAACGKGAPAYCAQFGPLNGGGSRTDGKAVIHDHQGHALSGFFFGQSSFGEMALTHERNAIKVKSSLPIELLGPLGCGIQTGAGAIMRALRVESGSALLVLGGGAVGLSGVMAGAALGCRTIILSEPLAARRALALELGATHVVDPLNDDIVSSVLAIEPDGVDYAFDTSARMSAIDSALQCLTSRGSLGLVGVPTDPTSAFTTNMLQLIGRGLTVRGICEGDSDPATFIPELIALFEAGRFPFDRLIRSYPLDDINAAIADQASGACIKAILLPIPERDVA